MAKIHIGKKIQEAVEQSRFSVTQFANLINKSRTVVYDIFERDTLDTGLLQQISKVLNQNFFKYYNYDIVSTVKEEKTRYLNQAELLTALNDEIRRMRRQLNDLEKRYEALEKDKKGEVKKSYKKKPKK